MSKVPDGKPEMMTDHAAVARERVPMTDARFADMVARELPSAYRMAAVILGDQAEAEDATHDALLRSWEQWPRLRNPERAGAWFGRILTNLCRDRLRARRDAGVRRLTIPVAPSPLPDEAERESLWQAIGDLSPDHRIAIVLRYYLDLRLDEIAERTAVPVGTVKSRLHHALEALRATYAAQQRIEDRER